MLTTQNPFDAPTDVSSPLQITAGEIAVTATLFVCVVSTWTMALGDPELMATVAFVGIVVVLLAWAFLATWDRFEHRRR